MKKKRKHSGYKIITRFLKETPELRRFLVTIMRNRESFDSNKISIFNYIYHLYVKRSVTHDDYLTIHKSWAQWLRRKGYSDRLIQTTHYDNHGRPKCNFTFVIAQSKHPNI